ncbi:hypothetical protein AB1484_26420 [Parafrankia sp. FMc6]|uniref:hypothetical protein n=1 Tax=Parafrankia soli TaxID=2599596 RepID=UPI0034D6C5B2
MPGNEKCQLVGEPIAREDRRLAAGLHEQSVERGDDDEGLCRVLGGDGVETKPQRRVGHWQGVSPR